MWNPSLRACYARLSLQRTHTYMYNSMGGDNFFQILLFRVNLICFHACLYKQNNVSFFPWHILCIIYIHVLYMLPSWFRSKLSDLCVPHSSSSCVCCIHPQARASLKRACSRVCMYVIHMYVCNIIIKWSLHIMLVWIEHVVSVCAAGISFVSVCASDYEV